MGGETLVYEKTKYRWLTSALSYFADKEVKQFNIIDRLANAVNEEVALSTLYDAMRTLKAIISSKRGDEVRRFVSKFGKVETHKGEPHYCYEGMCPMECEEVEDKCCCNAEALYKLALRDADELKKSIREGKKEAFLDLKVIAINALG